MGNGGSWAEVTIPKGERYMNPNEPQHLHFVISIVFSSFYSFSFGMQKMGKSKKLEKSVFFAKGRVLHLPDP